jgi:protein tyrosine/serine phosphatase
MIHRLRKVTDQLYRGSAPSPKDVLWLKENLGIKKIVSLDKIAGDRIDRTTKLLGIKHIICPIGHPNFKHSLLHFLKHDLKELLLEGGPTYVHCQAGKDRTGLAVALVQCKYLGKSPEDALEEAKSLGFGLDVDPKPIHVFEKLIKACKPAKDKDTNHADIVSNEREYISDNRDSFLDEGHQGSFAPYLNVTRQNPQDALYNFVVDQSPTRENYHHGKPIKEHESQEEDVVPMVGVYDNDAGGRGFGPAENNGGFIYD